MRQIMWGHICDDIHDCVDNACSNLEENNKIQESTGIRNGLITFG